MTDAITSAVSDIFTVMGTAFTQIQSNDFLMLFVGATVIGLAIGIFKGLRSAV